MDSFSALESVAEVGIAITGFARLVAVRGHRSNEPWTEEDRINLRSLPLWSVGSVFLAYVPIVPSSSGDAIRDPWRTSNAIFAVFPAYALYETFRAVTVNPLRPMTRLEKSLVALGVGVLGGEILAAAGVLGSLAVRA